MKTTTDNKTRLSDEPFIGIVTVLYNSNDVLPGFFKSLAAQSDIRHRLYVIDNSPDDSGTRLSRSLAEEHGIDARFLFNDANYGVAKGNNLGIAMALEDRCSHVLFANNDTEFPQGTISGLHQSLSESDAWAVTPKIYYHGTQRLLWYAGGKFGAWTMRTPHVGNHEADDGQHDLPGPTEYAPTCFLLVPSRIFTDVGRMDERYFCYYDDTDFVWRLRDAGGVLRYEPGCIVEHKVSTSTGGDLSPFSLYYMNRNRIYFARKNLKSVQKIFALFYMTITRLPRALQLSPPLRARLLKGVKDGWSIPLPPTS